MDFENYAERIKPLVDFKPYQKPKVDMKDVIRISTKKGEMTTKKKISQLNDKRFYFPDSILFQTYRHPSLKEIDEYKKNKGQRIEKYFWDEKETF